MTDRILLFPAHLTSSRKSEANLGRQRSKQADKPMMRHQLERITRLLDDLEQIVGPDRDAPALQHRFGVERARRLVQQLAERHEAGGKVPEGDPQPYIDHQVLERMYWELNPRS